MYPFRLIVDSRPDGTEQYYAKNLKTGLLKGLGYYPHYASPDLEEVKEHFKKSVKSSAEVRIKWLNKQLEDLNGIAQGIVDKINKF